MAETATDLSDMFLFDTTEATLRDMQLNKSHLEAEVNQNCITYDFATEAIAMGVLCMLGIAGNTVSITCLNEMKSKTAVPFLLICLEVTNILFLTCVLILRVFSSVAEYSQWSSAMIVFPFLAKYAYPAALCCTTGSIYMTVLVTVYRSASLRVASKESETSSKRNARIHMSIVALCSLLYNIPRFFEYDITTYIVDEESYVIAVKTGLAKSAAYTLIYSNVLYCIVMYLGPLVILCMFNIKITTALNATKIQNNRLLGGHPLKSENDMTRVVFVFLLVFFVLQTPALITQVLAYFLPDGSQHCPYLFFFYERISDLLVVLNCSINFLVYCSCSKRFRKILMNKLCKPHQKGLKEYSSVNSYAPTNGKQEPQGFLL